MKNTLRIIGWMLIVSGFVGGGVFANETVELLYSDYTRFNALTFTVFAASGVIFGSLFLAAAEALGYLKCCAEAAEAVKDHFTPPPPAAD